MNYRSEATKRHRYFIVFVKDFDMERLQWKQQRVEETAKLEFAGNMRFAFDYKDKVHFIAHIIVKNWITGNIEPIWTMEKDDIDKIFDRLHINIHEPYFDEYFDVK